MSEPKVCYFLNKESAAQEVDAEKGIIEFPVSSEGIDRYEDVIIQAGISTVGYNNIVLFNHNMNKPIGQVIGGLRKDTATGITYASIKFDRITQEDKDIYDKVISGTIRSTSVSILINDWGWRKVKELDRKVSDPILKPDDEVFVIFKSSLLELSVVTVPANPDATKAASWRPEKENNKNMKISPKDIDEIKLLFKL